jgi:hypothetical protein
LNKLCLQKYKEAFPEAEIDEKDVSQIIASKV